jgi:ribosomal protein S18 acetylase RimI-like enzyme
MHCIGCRVERDLSKRTGGIDVKFQGRGYGKQAMQLIIRDIEGRDDRTDVILVGYHQDNFHAKRLYEKVGFQEIGIAPWGEILAKYCFKNLDKDVNMVLPCNHTAVKLRHNLSPV